MSDESTTEVEETETEETEEGTATTGGRQTKYEYPEGMTDPDEKKKYRRQQRKAAQGKTPREPKTDAEGNPVARTRRQKPEAKTAHNYTHEDLLTMFAETPNGAPATDDGEVTTLEFDGDLEAGYAFAISGSAINPASYVKKFKKRHGIVPLSYNVRGTDMLILGPIPDDQGPTPAEAPEEVSASA